MKIKLSKLYWMNLYVMLGIFITIVVSLYEPKYSNEDLFISLCFIIVYTVLLLFVILMRKNYLMVLEIDEMIIRSFLFGKFKSEVNMEHKVFYAVFKCNESNTNTKTYIALSNEKFTYEEKERRFWSIKTFIDCYDTNKIIVCPYDEETKKLFPVEKWIDVR